MFHYFCPSAVGMGKASTEMFHYFCPSAFGMGKASTKCFIIFVLVLLDIEVRLRPRCSVLKVCEQGGIFIVPRLL